MPHRECHKVTVVYILYYSPCSVTIPGHSLQTVVCGHSLQSLVYSRQSIVYCLQSIVYSLEFIVYSLWSWSVVYRIHKLSIVHGHGTYSIVCRLCQQSIDHSHAVYGLQSIVQCHSLQSIVCSMNLVYNPCKQSIVCSTRSQSIVYSRYFMGIVCSLQPVLQSMVFSVQFIIHGHSLQFAVCVHSLKSTVYGRSVLHGQGLQSTVQSLESMVVVCSDSLWTIVYSVWSLQSKPCIVYSIVYSLQFIV